MSSKLKRLLRNESGITGLETAIILIAFVVVAAVFAFTVLSAGVFSAEQSKEAVYAGLEEVTGSMEIRGDVIAEALDVETQVVTVTFNVANVAGGQAIDLTEPSTGNNVVVLHYRDERQREEIDDWTQAFKGKNDGDDLLEEGELAEITVPISSNLTVSLTVSTDFAIEAKPPQGGVLVIEKTTPPYIDKVMALY